MIYANGRCVRKNAGTGGSQGGCYAKRQLPCHALTAAHSAGIDLSLIAALRGENMPYQGTITPVCQDGFTLDADAVCGLAGMWRRDSGNCTPDPCPMLTNTDIPNLDIDSSLLEENFPSYQTFDFPCRVGFRRNGAAYCSEGNWEIRGTCDPLPCT